MVIMLQRKIPFFFYLGFTARQDYFTHFEPCQSINGAKTGDPREKTPDHMQAELGLSHMCEARTHSGEKKLFDWYLSSYHIWNQIHQMI